MDNRLTRIRFRVRGQIAKAGDRSRIGRVDNYRQARELLICPILMKFHSHECLPLLCGALTRDVFWQFHYIILSIFLYREYRCDYCDKLSQRFGPTAKNLRKILSQNIRNLEVACVTDHCWVLVIWMSACRKLVARLHFRIWKKPRI